VYTASYAIFDTVLGWMGVMGSPAGLLRTTLPQPSSDAAFMELRADKRNALEQPEHFLELIERIRRFSQGENTSFPDILDLSKATPFRRAVWENTRLIPYGEVRSYGWLAARTGVPAGARAVGQCMAKNPLPIVVPCHRVIAADGGLGGYGGGLGLKIKRLELEGVKIQGSL